MTKRGPLNKAEVFYIEQNPDKKSAEEIANELSRSVGQIRKVMINTTKKNIKKKAEIAPTRISQVDSLMGKKVRNEQIVATTMTPAASQYLDEKRTQLKGTKHLDSIHRPKG